MLDKPGQETRAQQLAIEVRSLLVKIFQGPHRRGL